MNFLSKLSWWWFWMRLGRVMSGSGYKITYQTTADRLADIAVAQLLNDLNMEIKE